MLLVDVFSGRCLFDGSQQHNIIYQTTGRHSLSIRSEACFQSVLEIGSEACSEASLIRDMIHDVSVDESASDRGRVPAHEVKMLHGVLRDSRRRLRAWTLRRKKQRQRLQRQRLCGSINKPLSPHYRWSRAPMMSRRLRLVLDEHFMSYDAVSRPTVKSYLEFYAHNVRMKDPVGELSEYVLFRQTGFWTESFTGTLEGMVLIPEIIRGKDRHVASKPLAFFVLLRRWHYADNWEDVALAVGRPGSRVWCMRIYEALFDQLAKHYRPLVQALDFRRIKPLLAGWSDEIQAYTGSERDVLLWVDGKPVKTCRPGKGKRAQEVAAAAAVGANLVQQAFWNGHYKSHGLKQSTVVQAAQPPRGNPAR